MFRVHDRGYNAKSDDAFRSLARVKMLVFLLAIAFVPSSHFGRVQSPAAPLSFEGRLLGVSARLSLYEKSGSAFVILTGIPLGGRIAGKAWIDDSGIVRMEPSLEASLSIRMCTLISVQRSADGRQVSVKVRLPLFGIRNMLLSQISPQNTIVSV